MNNHVLKESGSDEVLERLVVFRTGGKSAIDKTDERDITTEAELFVAGTEDGLMKNVFDAVFGEGETRDKLVVTA